MATVSERFVLTGPREGKTVVLGKRYEFVKGVMEYTGEPADIAKLDHVLRRYYGVVTERELVQDDGDDGAERQPAEPPVGKVTLEEAVAMLDPDQNAHWTNQGLPNLNTLAELTGTKVTRQDLDAIAPDLKRSSPVAK